MTALTKSEMADRLHERLGLNKREAKELVEHHLILPFREQEILF